MTIVIVDDDLIVRDSLKVILEQDPDITVAALGQNHDDALFLYDRHEPDVLLIDIRMGEKTGLEAAEKILAKHPAAKVLFLTTFQDRDYVLKALDIGAKGYLLKQDYQSIGPALKAVASGQTVFGADIIQALPDMLRQPQTGAAQKDLTDREMAVLRLCAEGLSNKQIASALFLSEGTVRNYISALLQKFDLRDRTQLVVAYYKGLG